MGLNILAIMILMVVGAVVAIPKRFWMVTNLPIGTISNPVLKVPPTSTVQSVERLALVPAYEI